MDVLNIAAGIRCDAIMLYIDRTQDVLQGHFSINGGVLCRRGLLPWVPQQLHLQEQVSDMGC